MLTLLLLLMHPLVDSNLNSRCSMMQEIIQIIKDTKVTTTRLTQCITQEAIMVPQITISSKRQYSRTNLNINRCSNHQAVPQEVETVDFKKEEEEVVTINSELTLTHLIKAFENDQEEHNYITLNANPTIPM
jgi:hypothetical protein